MDAQPAPILPAESMRSLNALAETTRNVRGVPVKPQTAAPVNARFRLVSSPDGENPTRPMAHLAAKLAGREHGRVETHGGGKTVAPRIQREPRAEHAQKRTIAGGGEREEFIHKRNIAKQTNNATKIFQKNLFLFSKNA